MAISDKLNYLIETKSKFKDRLNSLGAEIINSTTFRNYIVWVNDFYNKVSDKTYLAETGIVGRTSQSGTPTPDSPQSINNLTGNVSYTVSGKNKILTNISNWESGQYNSGGYKQDMVSRIRLKELLPIKPNTTYYVDTFDTTGFSLNHVFILRECDENGDFINSIGTVSSTNTFTTRNDTYYLMVTIGTTSTQSGETFTDYQTYFSDEKLKPFICLNSEIDKSYEPYIEPRTFTIPLGDIELCEIDTYKDKIYSNNGKFYLEKNTDKIILNGNEFIEKFSVTGGNLFRFQDIAISVSNISPKSNYFIGVSNSSSRYDGTVYYNYSAASNRMVFDILTTKFTTVAEFKSWLLTHNTELQFAIPTPTTTEITSSNYPELYSVLKEVQDYLTQYKINKEFLLDYSSPEITY